MAAYENAPGEPGDDVAGDRSPPLILSIRADLAIEGAPDARPRFGATRTPRRAVRGLAGFGGWRGVMGAGASMLLGAGALVAAFVNFDRWPSNPVWLHNLANPKIDYRAAELLEHAAFVQRQERWEQRKIRLGAGEPVIAALRRAGASPYEAESALNAITRAAAKPVFRAGQEITAYFDRAAEAPHLAGLTLHLAPDASIMLERTANGDFRSRVLTVDLYKSLAFVEGEIEGSLYQSARIAGASDREVDLFVEVFKYDVDFQRDIQAGDRFSIFFEKYGDDRGRLVKTGEALFLSLDARSIHKKFYRFTTPDDGKADFYDLSGQSARKFLIRTPVNSARITSGFGLRKHPILGYTKLHKGIDFAAPTGAPIVAAAAGTVIRANWFGTYGRYVRIRHSNGFETAYAHMSGFAAGVRAGAKVTQGQRIGYVGTTGRSTGPHLHYEVLLKGQAVNPASLKPQTGRQLTGAMLGAFQAEARRIDAAITAPAAPVKIGHPR